MRKAIFITVCIAGLLVSNVASAQGNARQIDPDPGMGYLSAIHGIPGLPEKVEVYVNQKFQFAFDYQDRIGPLALPAGTYELQVRLQGVPVLTEKTTLKAGTSATAIAHLTESAGINLAIFENNLEDIRRNAARLIVRHTAAAPEVAVELQNVLAQIGPIRIPGFANGDQIGPVDIDAGTYEASLFLGRAEVFNSGFVTLPQNATTIVYAIGNFPETFSLFVEEYRK